MTFEKTKIEKVGKLISIKALKYRKTSGKFLLPQILKIIKIGMPFLTKFIGI